MPHPSESPFDSIESAHEFLTVLAEAVADAKRDIESDVQRELHGSASRRLDAFRLAAYNVEKLELHLNKSCRILNDLRSLRRLLFEERSSARVPVIAKPAQPAVPEIKVRKPPLSLPAALQSPSVAPAGRPRVVA